MFKLLIISLIHVSKLQWILNQCPCPYQPINSWQSEIVEFIQSKGNLLCLFVKISRDDDIYWPCLDRLSMWASRAFSSSLAGPSGSSFPAPTPARLALFRLSACSGSESEASVFSSAEVSPPDRAPFSVRSVASFSLCFLSLGSSPSRASRRRPASLMLLASCLWPHDLNTYKHTCMFHIYPQLLHLST